MPLLLLPSAAQKAEEGCEPSLAFLASTLCVRKVCAISVWIKVYDILGTRSRSRNHIDRRRKKKKWPIKKFSPYRWHLAWFYDISLATSWSQHDSDKFQHRLLWLHEGLAQLWVRNVYEVELSQPRLPFPTPRFFLGHLGFVVSGQSYKAENFCYISWLGHLQQTPDIHGCRVKFKGVGAKFPRKPLHWWLCINKKIKGP